VKSFICGFSGAGKSFLLKERKQAGTPKTLFVDLDQYIFENYAKGHECLGDFIRSVGIDEFRNLEYLALTKLVENKSIMIALGGGALNERTSKLLESNGFEGEWLDTPFEICFERIQNDKNRPLANLGKEKLSELFEERAKWYSVYKKISL